MTISERLAHIQDLTDQLVKDTEELRKPWAGMIDAD